MSLDFSLYAKCEVCDKYGECKKFFSSNITHNLGQMARAAGIYEVLWRPEEHGYVFAKDIIEILQKGYDDLVAKPEFYSQYNSPNGWGMYDHFVEFVRECLDACKQYPDAKIDSDV